MDIKTPSDLKWAMDTAGKSPHFFTRKSMRFFGDTMRNYGLRRVTIKNQMGETVECYELYRRKPVKHGLQSSTFFRVSDLTRTYLEVE